MLNHIWTFMIVIGIVVMMGATMKNVTLGETITRTVDGVEVTERVQYSTWDKKLPRIAEAGNSLSKEVFNMVGFDYTNAAGGKSSGAVGIAVSYIGMIAVWLGLMKIAEAAGLIQALSRAIAPLFRIIFPSIPRDHPASGAILLNFSANMLGLDNAATPLGIKAMIELQKLNGEKEKASHAMCMFLALNVSSLTLIPASVIAFRAGEGSASPAEFLPAMWIATFVGSLSAFLMCKFMERITKDTLPARDEKAIAEPVVEGTV